jgi:hypothetical protein
MNTLDCFHHEVPIRRFAGRRFAGRQSAVSALPSLLSLLHSSLKDNTRRESLVVVLSKFPQILEHKMNTLDCFHQEVPIRRFAGRQSAVSALPSLLSLLHSSLKDNTRRESLVAVLSKFP